MVRTLLALIALGTWAPAGAAQQSQPLGTTPVPTARDLEDERKVIAGVVDPKNTLDLVEGRTRVILLKATPTRTQVADDSVMSFKLLEPAGKQMTVLGTKVGMTVLTLWFRDPADKDKELILSYLVRVLPDPEAKTRLVARYDALAAEVNKAFPDSRVRIALVAAKPVLTGQAHDVRDATLIRRVIQK
jgi:pilus assembly protein CpaC